MDLATIVAKSMRQQKQLADLDVSEEINACSISIDVMVNHHKLKYFLMFKNETHNHPTEIEPYGGAATCLGGAIRDPLSGRSYVYQAMRVTGAADPTASVSKTLAHKLPQRTICINAARGFSAYGNQIGLATGQVDEIYHPQYVAKRLEIGAVIGAVPQTHVKRLIPQPTDVVILIGGRTGKDGVGGASGSSKIHDDKSTEELGAQVQKGNPITERKIQRLFLNPKVTKLIKRCNDFGAGGICVAVGELCPGLDIDLSVIPVKYIGLDATALAIAESQERMAVLVAKKDVSQMLAYAKNENLEATVIAKVTSTNHLRMFYQKQCVVDIDRDFLNTNGAVQYSTVKIAPINKIVFSKTANKSCTDL
jgi:phosphoribosylformylglycinamidine synthase